MYQELCHEAKISQTFHTCETGDNNDSGLSEMRHHEGDILSKRQSSRVRKRAINYLDNDHKSDPEDSGTEYDKVVVLGSQIASKEKRRRKIFKKSESLIDIKTRVNHGKLLIHQ